MVNIVQPYLTMVSHRHHFQPRKPHGPPTRNGQLRSTKVRMVEHGQPRSLWMNMVNHAQICKAMASDVQPWET